MSIEYREPNQLPQDGMTGTIPPLTNHSVPQNAPIEPGHSLATGAQLVHDQEKSEADDDYGHQFVLKRLRRDLPLPGRWTLIIML